MGDSEECGVLERVKLWRISSEESSALENKLSGASSITCLRQLAPGTVLIPGLPRVLGERS